jgi:hypothetical protein
MADRRRARVIRWPVSSSVLRSIGYDPERHFLDVEFHDGDVYRYADLEADVYEAFMAAPSKGRFFNQHIRYGYEYEQLT